MSTQLGRKDPFTPQGYLRGFIHPERLRHATPLWVYAKAKRRWTEKSPRAIGFEVGYYDYSLEALTDTTADDEFMRLENDLPQIRERIRRDGYESWTEHRDLLVSFAGMLAARSPMFRTQAEARLIASLQREAAKSVLAKDYAITLMRTEIKARRHAWQSWDWALAFTMDPADPVITSDQAVGMWGNGQDQALAFLDDDFWLWCPLAWDMCLLASSKPLTKKRLTRLHPNQLAELRWLTLAQSARFVVSPVRLF